MLHVRLVAVGGLKEKYWRQAADEYIKRLSRYCRLEVLEVPDEPAPESLSPALAAKVLATEGERIIKRLQPSHHAILLDIGGHTQTSEALAQKLQALAMHPGHVTFIIGGSLGVSDAVKSAAQERWSFSPLTFPHQLARIMLLEQLYRGFRIINNEPYHK